MKLHANLKLDPTLYLSIISTFIANTKITYMIIKETYLHLTLINTNINQAIPFPQPPPIPAQNLEFNSSFI